MADTVQQRMIEQARKAVYTAKTALEQYMQNTESAETNLTEEEVHRHEREIIRVQEEVDRIRASAARAARLSEEYERQVQIASPDTRDARLLALEAFKKSIEANCDGFSAEALPLLADQIASDVEIRVKRVNTCLEQSRAAIAAQALLPPRASSRAPSEHGSLSEPLLVHPTAPPLSSNGEHLEERLKNLRTQPASHFEPPSQNTPP